MARKTFDVLTFKNKVNGMLARSTCSAAEREVMSMLLTDVLHETGNYHGFRYLHVDEVPPGHNPGVRYAEDGSVLPSEERFTDTDTSRVSYY